MISLARPAPAEDRSTRLATVVRVDDVQPHLRRITVGGDDLVGYPSPGFDGYVLLLVPRPGVTELPVDRSFTPDDLKHLRDDGRPYLAYYTIRAARPDEGELDIEMVLHHEAGVVSQWAAQAEPGLPVGLYGPRVSWKPPAPPKGYLLVADDTGLPAVAAILDGLEPADPTPVHVIAEVQDPEQQPALDLRADHWTVDWQHRGDHAPGTTTLLFDAVWARGPVQPEIYVWGGMEGRAAGALRRYLKDFCGLDRSWSQIQGYWRLPVPKDSERFAPGIPDDPD